MCRFFKDFDSEEFAIFCCGIKKMYNIDFINTYMEKDDYTVVIDKNFSEEFMFDEYFSEIPTLKKKGLSSMDFFYVNLEKFWYMFKCPIEEINLKNLWNFLMNMMNKECKICVIADNCKIFFISCALSRYINKEDEFFVELEVFH